MIAAMRARHLEPEWLDTLPADDASALRSRRDLVRVNALMGNAAIVASLLRGLPQGRALRLAELGSGDGLFAARVLRRLRGGGTIALIDRQARADPAVFRAAAGDAWRPEPVHTDVFDALRDPTPFDAIFANLFLHHFGREALARLLEAIAQRTPLFAACEPRRSAIALAGSHLLGLAGCGPVTRHDAVVSVRAGFSGRELSALWPGTDGWHLDEARRGLFSHGFRAARA